MIRFRVGHSWKREPIGPGGPRDAFALELEGINLLPGANDEPLVRIVTALIDTVAALAIDGERAGQVSLEDVRLELCFWRGEGHEVSVSVIDLSHPPRQVRAPIVLEFPKLVEATVRCARNLAGDLEEHRSQGADLASLERRLKRLKSCVIEERPRRSDYSWSAVRSAHGGLGFSLRDDEGRTLAWGRKTRAGLPPLLFDGNLTLADGPQQPGLPFLSMMGLARAAAEGGARIAGQRIPADQVYLAGIDLCLALRSRNPALGGNPYVEALQVRCTDGLIAMRQPVPDTTMARVSPPRSTPGPPLAAVGDVRRVSLEPGWIRDVSLGEEGGRLLLHKQWIIAHSACAVQAFSKKGRPAFRHQAARGVSLGSDGVAVCATPERLLLFSGSNPIARWLRDHDGAQIGPRLDAIGEVLLCQLERRGIVAFSRGTGRELWRFEPPRTQALFLSRIGTKALVGTDDGTLYGLDAHDGQVRFRLKAGLPVVYAPVAVRNRALVVLNRGEHSAIYLCEAVSRGGARPAGSLIWTRELILSSPSAPVTARGLTWIGGARDGRTMLVCLGQRGQLLWEKSIPCDVRTLSLLPWEGGVFAADARGSATRVLPDGVAEWVLGSPGDELARAVPLAVRRQTLVVPGPVTRLVQPRSGRVLAELATGPRMLDLASDARLTLYVLREPGRLETFKTAAALALILPSR